MKLSLLLYIGIVSGSHIRELMEEAAQGKISCKDAARIGPPFQNVLLPHLKSYWTLWATDEKCHYYLSKLAPFFAQESCITQIWDRIISSEPEQPKQPKQ